MAYCKLEWKAGKTELCGLEREVCWEMVDMRLRLKLDKRSRSLGARGRGARPSIVSGEWVYGIGGLGEVAGWESTSAMFEVSVEFV